MGFLPGPVQRFAFWALATGVMLPILSGLLPRVLEPSAQDRFARWLLVATALKMTGLALGGIWSVYGVQVVDPRPKSVVVMALRILGDAILLVCLTRLAVVWIRSGRQRS